MLIQDVVGSALYEQIRATIIKAFPSAGDLISDDVVDAFIREFQRRAPPWLEKLGLPELPFSAGKPLCDTNAYPLYIAHATHKRVRKVDSTQPFHSEFVGHLPTVRVPLPEALNDSNTQVSTPIGTVDFARDHLIGSVELCARLYASELGYAPARVDLITPARSDGMRFAAIAVYLGYREKNDGAPSFYLLEAGLATGQAAMLYLGTTMDATIVQSSGYQPTPFASPDNTYKGKLLVQDDQPVELLVQANAPNLPFYIQVTVNYEAMNSDPDISPILLTVEAVERVAAIGKAMDVSTGMPNLLEDVLSEIALLFLPWIEEPKATSMSPRDFEEAFACTNLAEQSHVDTPCRSRRDTSSLTPRSPTKKETSGLTQRLLSIGEELVRNYQAICTIDEGISPSGDEKGVSSAFGHAVELPSAIKEEIERVLRDVEHDIEADPAPRLAVLLGGVKVKKTAPDPSVLPNGASVVAKTSALALGSGPDGSITGPGKRQTWANQLANQKVQPLSIFCPISLSAPSDSASIEAILKRAAASGCAVKAAGSGHSYSDVATTPDFFVDTHGLDRVSSLEAPITGQLSPADLKSPLPLSLGPITFPSYDPEKNRALIEVEAGITIRALNTLLESRNLGLMNMGGYDGQTIVGAISTSTHGSGITLGPFPDMVRSLVLATTGRWNGKTIGGQDGNGGVYYYRIEPSDGITDPAKYDDSQIALIQDDDCFNAVVCSMGCFGIIYSVVLEVIQMYWLEENRYLTTLDQVIKDLSPNPDNPGHMPDVLLNTRNYEVLIQPYPLNGLEVVHMDPNEAPETYYRYFTCLVTKRTIAPPPEGPAPKGRTPFPDWLGTLLDLALNEEPALTPEAIDLSLLTLTDQNYVDKSFAIYNLGLGGGVGFAAEVGFAADDGYGSYTEAHFKAAIDRIHRLAQRAREEGEQYQSSAFSLRFVQKSNAHLSMMQGRNTAMIEMDMLTGTYGGEEIMYRYETNMYALGGRPHWGLEFDHLSGNNDLVGKMYPKLGRWLAVYQKFNALGTFNNSFTQRMGFTVLE